jgi:hypothetical protein
MMSRNKEETKQSGRSQGKTYTTRTPADLARYSVVDQDSKHQRQFAGKVAPQGRKHPNRCPQFYEIDATKSIPQTSTPAPRKQAKPQRLCLSGQI